MLLLSAAIPVQRVNTPSWRDALLCETLDWYFNQTSLFVADDLSFNGYGAANSRPIPWSS
jgi:hypothetical protein